MSSPWIFEGTDVVRLTDQTDKVRIGAGGTPSRALEVIGSALVTLQDKGGNVFDVKAYGATGNGTTPDSGSINTAATALMAAGGGTLYFPNGTYLIDQPIVINNAPFLMRGAGPEASIIKMISTNPTGDFIKTNFGVGTAAPDPVDREMYMEIRDLKFVSAAATPTAGAAILQQAIPDPHDPPLPLVFQNTFIVRNCWFLNVWDAIHLTDTGSAVIKDCQILNPLHAAIFLESTFNSANHTDAGTTFICDNFIWERGPTSGNHGSGHETHGILATAGVSGMRVHHNSFISYDRPIYIDLTDVGAKTIIHIDHNSFDGGSSDAKIHVTNLGLLHTLDVSSNDFTIAPVGTGIGIGILVDVNGSIVGKGLVNAVIAGNTFNGSDPQQLSRKGIVLAPANQAVVQRVVIADNIFTDLSTAIDVGVGCDRIYIGDNAFENVGTPLSVASPTATRTLGAFFPDRVGVGRLNDLTTRKDLYVYSSDPFGPRLHLQGEATSSPGIDFAFDNLNSRRAGIVGAASGTSGVQMDFYTKPDGDSLKRRVIIDRNGRFQHMGLTTPPVVPGAIDFMFDAETSPRASIVATPAPFSGAQLEFSTGSSIGGFGLRAMVTSAGHFVPGTDNAYTLGVASTGRWKDFFAVAKHSVLNTSFGSGVTLVPVLEGPEYLLYDSGSVTLGPSGEEFVDLDPRFVEITNTDMPYRVLTSGCKVKARESKRFSVKGDPGDVVDWMVVAVRAGFENVRFRDAQNAEPVGQEDPEHAVARKSPDNNKA